MKKTVRKIQQRLHFQQFMLDKKLYKIAGLKKEDLEEEVYKQIEGAK